VTPAGSSLRAVSTSLKSSSKTAPMTTAIALTTTNNLIRLLS
jgi:hypothetical protein